MKITKRSLIVLAIIIYTNTAYSQIFKVSPIKKDYSAKVLNDSIRLSDGVKIKFDKYKYFYGENGYDYVIAGQYKLNIEQIETITLDGKKYANLYVINQFHNKFVPCIYSGDVDIYQQVKKRDIGDYETGRIKYKITKYYYANDTSLLKKANYKNLKNDFSHIPEVKLNIDQYSKIKKGTTISYIGSAALLVGGIIATSQSNDFTSSSGSGRTSIQLGPALMIIGTLNLPLTYFISKAEKERAIKKAMLVLMK